MLNVFNLKIRNFYKEKKYGKISIYWGESKRGEMFKINGFGKDFFLKMFRV